MEKPAPSPATSLTPEPPRRRRPRTGLLLRLLVALLVAAGVLGAVWLALPAERPASRAPAPAPGTEALSAVTDGAPAALGDLAALIGERERRVRLRPRDAGAWAVLGAAYVERGRRTANPANYPMADDALRTSLRLRPKDNAEALAGLAALADERRDFRTARSYGEAALKLDPKRWTAYPPLIDACTGLGDYKATGRALDKLLKLRHAPAVKARAAGVYWDRGWREDAAAQLSDAAAAAATPVEQAAYVERAGRIAFDRGDREDALRHFDAALRLDPDQREARAGRGRALAALGRTEQALKAYHQAVDRRPSPQYLLELGELYQSLGREREAAAQYARLRDRVRQETAAGVDDELVLGRFEADHAGAEPAVRRLRAEWRRQPGIPVADALGWALHRAGQDEEALKFATAAMDSTKGGGVRDALYAFHRGVIEQSLDRTGAARRHLEEALRTNPYFSPLWGPEARAALDALGEPSVEDVPGDADAGSPASAAAGAEAGTGARAAGTEAQGQAGPAAASGGKVTATAGSDAPAGSGATTGGGTGGATAGDAGAPATRAGAGRGQAAGGGAGQGADGAPAGGSPAAAVRPRPSR
ncbi:tetratricopeptide repeat protein [Streptomyces naganishii]|uniref:tetratricopeptide repeat protein n=1 Tax=Streptomyces naganishii TaxID=285447 RepID=UPI00368AB857